jgi:copper chaperone CopZ
MILKVEGMHCPKCVERISKALAAADIKCKVTLETKTVEVADADADKAIEELDDIGFDAVK